MSKNVMLLVLVGAAACGDDGESLKPDGPLPTQDAAVDSPPMVDTCQPKALDTSLTWSGTNRADLEKWLASRGCDSPTYDPNNKPIALFDWDNTIGKNDFGDAITFYLVANNKVLQPPNQDWKQTSGYMTDAGAAALTAACGTTVAAGSPLPTSTDTDCADEIVNMYINNQTTGGATAFGGHNWRTLEPTYAWTAQLMAGYTHAEVQAMATAAITPQLTAAMGATQTIGTKTGLNGWLRIYDQSKDLVEVTRSYGYDIWVITASPQDVIQTFAPMIGVNADHVVGIRSKTDSNNKLTYRFEGCGTVADNTQSMIPYIQGKRCWVNKIVYGDATATAMRKRADGARQVFAAGDSDTDIEFMRDAEFKFAIDRNKSELMCHAFYNANDSWRVNPMFISPRAKKTTPYPCSTTACRDEAGTPVPCRDDAGNIIPDQLEP